MDLVAIPILITDPNKIVRYQSFKYPDHLLKKNRIENSRIFDCRRSKLHSNFLRVIRQLYSNDCESM